MKKIIFPLLLISCFIMIMLWPSLTPLPSNSNSQQPVALDLSAQRPLIFLHGSGGSETDLLPFANALLAPEKQDTAKLFVSISKEDQLSYQGELTLSQAQPLIFVGFEDGFAPIEEWAESLVVLLDALAKQYQFKEIDLVGFSNGGLAATYFAEIASEHTDLPLTKKLVVIGAPFNDLEPLNEADKLDFSDHSGQDPVLTKFIDKQSQLDDKLAVLAIAGDVGATPPSDSVVPVTSALASRLIFPDFVYAYEERLSSSGDASHIGLVDGNLEVITWVKDFLFQTHTPQGLTLIP